MRASRRHAAKELAANHFAKCMHPVSSAFKMLYATASLPCTSTCPECLIARITLTLATTRREIEVRGGCFASKDLDKYDHDRRMDYWYVASLHGFQVARLLEGFLHGEGAKEDDVEAAEMALGAWERFRETFRVPPGMVESDEVSRMDVDVALLVKYITILVNRLWEEIEEREKGEAVPFRRTVAEILRNDADTGGEEIQVPVEGATTERKSNLKRKRNRDTRPATPKRVKIADVVTVSPDHEAIVRYPFAVQSCPHTIVLPLLTDLTTTASQPPTVEEHKPTAFSEQRRRRATWTRGDARYVPGRWASPSRLEKQDTSGFRHSFQSFECIMKKEEKEWESQRREAERVAKVFKEISEAWVKKRSGGREGKECDREGKECNHSL
ncbi:hypothetical protein BU23DRAFT_600224 [Bimuria novae-zelandiae CBS 107.79]|uniref:Uncharacterized protein n=1 Tax=Bimuria novae-zelandiae CBS 107.79 TaxID=1447943 RepID=A0A6A5VEN8_9PLEO|nr:hypothetical protein BU23DRAFT_600224 [Bimuria novae-zelandiae CBS 107.79]